MPPRSRRDLARRHTVVFLASRTAHNPKPTLLLAHAVLVRLVRLGVLVGNLVSRSRSRDDDIVGLVRTRVVKSSWCFVAVSFLSVRGVVP